MLDASCFSFHYWLGLRACIYACITILPSTTESDQGKYKSGAGSLILFAKQHYLAPAVPPNYILLVLLRAYLNSCSSSKIGPPWPILPGKNSHLTRYHEVAAKRNSCFYHLSRHKMTRFWPDSSTKYGNANNLNTLLFTFNL